MNPDQPSREPIEARLTALLLGELPAGEAELLRWTIAQDPELQKLQTRLERTIGLVRETVKPPNRDIVGESVPRRLSEEKRRQLLAHFKTPRPQPMIPLRRFEMPRLVAALAVVAIIAVLASLLLPSLASAKRKAQRVTMLSGAGGLSGAKRALAAAWMPSR